MTWKKRVSKSNVLLYQLVASVRGIKGKESGLLPTPNTMDHIDRKGMRPSRAATNRKSGYLSKMIKMYPTPTARDWHSPMNPKFVKQNSKGWTVTRKGTGVKYGASIPDVVNKINNKPGGKLNPHFVEFLMAYPQDWTKIERTE